MTSQNTAYNTLIVGPSGAGKHLFATQRLVNHLAAGDTSVVFDFGGSFIGLVKSLGGTLMAPSAEGHYIATQYGTLPLTVVELEDAPASLDLSALPIPAPHEVGFVLIDESWSVFKTLPGVLPWLLRAAEKNAQVCLVMQSHQDIEPMPFLGEVGLQAIANFREVASPDELRPGELFRHQDGGLYRWLATAKHSEDLSDLVLYEHLWPFEPGRIWARPAQEWASRFTRIANSELQLARQQSRELAQDAVIRAKAARRKLCH